MVSPTMVLIVGLLPPVGRVVVVLPEGRVVVVVVAVGGGVLD